jgi:hypothetical protein
VCSVHIYSSLSHSTHTLTHSHTHTLTHTLHQAPPYISAVSLVSRLTAIGEALYEIRNRQPYIYHFTILKRLLLHAFLILSCFAYTNNSLAIKYQPLPPSLPVRPATKRTSTQRNIGLATQMDVYRPNGTEELPLKN